VQMRAASTHTPTSTLWGIAPALIIIQNRVPALSAVGAFTQSFGQVTA